MPCYWRRTKPPPSAGVRWSELVERAQRGDKGAYALIAGAIAIGFSRSRDALARPTGVGRAISTYTIPIEGRDEWLAAARRLA